MWDIRIFISILILHFYGMIIGAAILAGFLIATAEAKRTGQNSEDYIDLAINGVICDYRVRVYYVIFSWNMYIK